MSQPIRDNKIILNEDQIRAKLLEGAKASYDTVMTTFGPKGKNVLVEKAFGRPVLTRDGVTVAREVYFSDRAKNQGAQMLMEASETTNRIAGDGTSASCGLAYHLLKNGVQAIAAGVHPMQVKEMYMSDSYKLLDELDTLTKTTTDGQLKQVATVSAGDENLGTMIAEAIERVGVDGGIIAEKAPIEDVACEYVDGYYLQSGFQALQAGKKELLEPFVIVASKRIASQADAVDLLTMTAKAKQIQPGTIPKFVFIGNIEDGAYNCIVENVNQGRIDAVIIKTPPQFGDMGKLLLEDVAAYAGCEPVIDSTNLKSFNVSFIGSIDKIVASKSETTLFANNDTERVLTRIEEIKSQIDTETVDAILEKLRDRVAKLQGKIALFRIGAATDTAREELEYRVEDSIHATRAAAQYGVVPGGGSTWLTLSKTEMISSAYRDALRSVFKKLLTNANLPAEVKLEEALKADAGMGYNLRAGDELVDMTQAGVLDPVLVLQQVIKNATEVVANGLTVGTALIFSDETQSE